MENDIEYISVRERDVIIKVYVKDIIYLHAQEDYVAIHKKERKYLVHSTFKDILEKLPKTRFTQVHRSYIVQQHLITTIEGSTIYISQLEIPIGETYKQALKFKMNIV